MSGKNNEIMNKEYLSIADVRTYLNISQSAAYTLARRKDFPCSHFGGAIRIPRIPFLAWVDRQTKIPESLAMYMRTYEAEVN